MQFCKFFKSRFAISFDFLEHKTVNLPYHEHIDKLSLIKTIIYNIIKYKVYLSQT